MKSKSSNRNYALIPILFVLCVIPLLMRAHIYDPQLEDFPWYWNSNEVVDVFLYYKALALIVVAAFMFVIFIIAIFKDFRQRRHNDNFCSLKKAKWLIPLAAFGLLALLSTLFSDYKEFGFRGIMEQFESIWVVLSYCMVTVYAFYFIRTEKDINVVFKGFFIVLLLLCIIGFTQLIGHDFWATDLGKDLFIPSEHSKLKETIKFAFSGSGNHQVYLTFYNPNYVGMFAALVLPVSLMLCFGGKTLLHKISWGALTIFICLCALGSGSKAFLLSLAVTICLGIIFFICKNIKYLPVIVALLATFIIIVRAYSSYIDMDIFQYVKNALTPIKNTSYMIEDFIVEPDHATLKYNGAELSVSYENSVVNVWDETGSPVAYHADEYDYLHFEDERFKNITLTFYPGYEDLPYVAEICVANRMYNFTSLNGKLVFLNNNLEPDTIKRAEAAIFTDYDRLFSGRGYLWSRTLPLLKDTLLLGTGADTFALVFPQNDYVARANAGYAFSLITKPHSMYLQSAVQYGVLALICYLTVIVIYILQTITLCWKSNFKDNCSYLAFGILLGIIGYCILGITNDSCVALAPMAWILLGIGFAVNKILKRTTSNKE